MVCRTKISSRQELILKSAGDQSLAPECVADTGGADAIGTTGINSTGCRLVRIVC
jgi:hypothetical protein